MLLSVLIVTQSLAVITTVGFIFGGLIKDRDFYLTSGGVLKRLDYYTKGNVIAKNEKTDLAIIIGLCPCVAKIVAAQRFNAKKGNEIPCIYGATA